MRSLRDLIYCQEDSEGISHCQEDNEMRSLWDLIDYRKGRNESLDCQVGNGMGSEDLIDCQEGSREIPYS
jgi:hypothetical protein